MKHLFMQTTIHDLKLYSLNLLLENIEVQKRPTEMFYKESYS